MTTILILYYSRTGSTKRMAEKIAQGITQAGGETLLRTVPEVSTNCEQTQPSIPDEGAPYITKEDLKQCDGVIIGSPTRFGNIAAPLKYFIDGLTDLWLEGTLINKPAGVFTSTGSMHGGQESTLLSMMIPLFHHGAVLAGVPYSEAALQQTNTGGTPYGPSHYNGIHADQALSEDEIAICHAFGARLVSLAKQLKT